MVAQHAHICYCFVHIQFVFDNHFNIQWVEYYFCIDRLHMFIEICKLLERNKMETQRSIIDETRVLLN